MIDYKKITNDEWRERLTDMEYQICIEKGTEPAFSGEYHDKKTEGTYLCRCCGEPLFRSEHKYDSGSGWASFYQPLSSDLITECADTSHGMVRVETTCSSCGCHLGHVFTDGPDPTGLRYCTNSPSLQFKKE